MKEEDFKKTATLVEIAKLSLPSFFTAHRLARIRTLFDSMDADKNGSLDLFEIMPFFEYVSFRNLGITRMAERDKEMLFQLMDIDGNGIIDFANFVLFLVVVKEIEVAHANDKGPQESARKSTAELIAALQHHKSRRPLPQRSWIGEADQASTSPQAMIVRKAIEDAHKDARGGEVGVNLKDGHTSYDAAKVAALEVELAKARAEISRLKGTAPMNSEAVEKAGSEPNLANMPSAAIQPDNGSGVSKTGTSI